MINEGGVYTPPFLCIEIIDSRRRLQEVHEGIDDYSRYGVACVWLIDATGERAYTADAHVGFRECKSAVLRIENPVIELPIEAILLGRF